MTPKLHNHNFMTQNPFPTLLEGKPVILDVARHATTYGISVGYMTTFPREILTK
jgi:hypothetical protein